MKCSGRVDSPGRVACPLEAGDDGLCHRHRWSRDNQAAKGLAGKRADLLSPVVGELHRRGVRAFVMVANRDGRWIPVVALPDPAALLSLLRATDG